MPHQVTLNSSYLTLSLSISGTGTAPHASLTRNRLTLVAKVKFAFEIRLHSLGGLID